MGKTVSRLCGSGRPDRDDPPDLPTRRWPVDSRRRSLPYGAGGDGEIWVPLITIDRNANMKHVTLVDQYGDIFVKTSDELKGDMNKLECCICRTRNKCKNENNKNKFSGNVEQDTLCKKCQQQQINPTELTINSATSIDEHADIGTLDNYQKGAADVTETSSPQNNELGGIDNVTNDSVQFRNCPSQSKLALLTERLHKDSSDASLSTNDAFDVNDDGYVPEITSPLTRDRPLPRRNFSDGDLQSFLRVAKNTFSAESTSLLGTPKLFKRRQSDGHFPSFEQLMERREGSVSSKLSAIAERFGSGKRKPEVSGSFSPDSDLSHLADNLNVSTKPERTPKHASIESLTPPLSPGKTHKFSMRRKLSTIKENFGRRKSQDQTPEEDAECPGIDTKQLSTLFNRRKSENDLHVKPVGTPCIKRKEDGPKSPSEVKSPSVMRRFSRRQSDGNIATFLQTKQTRSPSIINTISGRLGRRKSDGHIHPTDFIKSSKITVDTKLARRLSQKACEHKKLSPTHANKPSLVNWKEAQLFQKEPLLIKTDEDTKRCWITGLAVLSEDYVLVTDHLNKSIKTVYVWDSMVTFSLPLESEPWAIALVSVDIVAVSLPFAKAVQFVSVREGSLALLPKIKTCGNCYGVASLGDRLCVSTFNPATVQIVSFTGIVLQTVAVDASATPLFGWPENLTATSDAIYVTDVNTDTVTKLTYDGDVIGQYKDDNLILPTGISSIDDQHLFVTSFGNGSLHVLSTDLKQVAVFDLKGQVNSMDAVGFCSESRIIYVRSNSFGASDVEDYLTVLGLD